MSCLSDIFNENVQHSKKKQRYVTLYSQQEHKNLELTE
jgi:hypothetical protein